MSEHRPLLTGPVVSLLLEREEAETRLREVGGGHLQSQEVMPSAGPDASESVTATHLKKNMGQTTRRGLGILLVLLKKEDQLRSVTILQM